MIMTHYFSTQGCFLAACFDSPDFAAEAPLAAAAFRALRSKKLAIFGQPVKLKWAI